MTRHRFARLSAPPLLAAGLAGAQLLFAVPDSSAAQEVRDHRRKPEVRDHRRKPEVRDHRAAVVEVATFDCAQFRYDPTRSDRSFHFVSAALAALGRAPLVGGLHCDVAANNKHQCRLSRVPPQVYPTGRRKFVFNVKGTCARFDISGVEAVRRAGPDYATYTVDLARYGATIRWELVFLSGPARGGALGNSLKVSIKSPTVTGGW